MAAGRHGWQPKWQHSRLEGVGAGDYGRRGGTEEDDCGMLTGRPAAYRISSSIARR
jgi:hypothetical protein